MRGDDQQQDGMFSYISPNKRVPQEHPLRRIRSIVDRVLDQLSPRFNKLYARAGRPSIAPEKLLRALLLQLLYSVRSERLLMEQLDYNLLFRWFVGLSMDDAVWDASTFSKNRERMLEGDIAEAFFQGVLGEARAGQLLSDEHFTVDGTLLEAWASHKSFRPVDPVGKDNDQEPKPPAARWDENNPTVNYRGEKRTNQTHCSTTDPQEKAETNRGSLRVAADGRDAAPTAPSRVRASGLGVHFGGCDVQLSAHADTDAEVCLKSAQRPELHVSWRNQNKYQTGTDRRISHEES